MKQILKHIKKTSLFITGLVILAHSIIPHHHHFGTINAQLKCTPNHTSQHLNHVTPVNLNSTQCDHEHEACIDCHFSPDASNPSIKKAIHVDFLQCHSNNFDIKNSIESSHAIPYCTQYSYSFQRHNSSRAPPSLIV